MTQVSHIKKTRCDSYFFFDRNYWNTI